MHSIQAYHILSGWINICPVGNQDNPPFLGQINERKKKEFERVFILANSLVVKFTYETSRTPLYVWVTKIYFYSGI